MTIPTTNVGMSNLQSEFGGTSPVSMSQYYKGGAFVGSNQTNSPTDPNPIPTSGTITIGEFRGVTKVNVNPGGVSASDTNKLSPATASVNLIFHSDGTTTYNSPDDSNSPISTTNWYSPTTPGIGSSYFLNTTVTSSTPAGLNPASSPSSVGTWASLGSGVTLSYSHTTSGPFASYNATINMDIGISSSNTGTPLLATWTATFSLVITNSA